MQSRATWRRRWSERLSVLACALLSASSMADQKTQFDSSAGPLRVATVAEGLDRPWGFEFLPDGRILVSERDGALRLVAPGGAVSAPLAGVPKVAARGQGGLLDVALDPDFARNRTVYLSYAEPRERGNGTAVARAVLGEGGLSEVKVIFRQQPAYDGSHHFGSRIVFARDGTLFVTLGDRYHLKERAQQPDSHIGKVVRIRSDGSAPPDNPFVGRAGALPEVWSIGHRNIQGAALHPDTGQLWTAEHGAQGGDEINTPQAGRNYGWPVITYGTDYGGGKIGEGTHKAGMEQPLHYWDPSIAPAGIEFYTGDRYPGWRGSLLVGSMKFQMLVRLELDGTRVVREERLLQGLGERIRDVKQGPDGLVYLATDARDGRLLRLEPAAR